MALHPNKAWHKWRAIPSRWSVVVVGTVVVIGVLKVMGEWHGKWVGSWYQFATIVVLGSVMCAFIWCGLVGLNTMFARWRVPELPQGVPTMREPAKRRRWFRPRFGLRILFVLVTVASVPFIWIGWHAKWKRDRRAALEKFRPIEGGFDHLDKQHSWGLRLLGEFPCPHMTVRVKTDEEEAAVEELRRLYPECQVRVERIPEGMRVIQQKLILSTLPDPEYEPTQEEIIETVLYLGGTEADDRRVPNEIVERLHALGVLRYCKTGPLRELTDYGEQVYDRLSAGEVLPELK